MCRERSVAVGRAGHYDRRADSDVGQRACNALKHARGGREKDDMGIAVARVDRDALAVFPCNDTRKESATRTLISASSISYAATAYRSV